MHKVENWPSVLDREIKARQSLPFQLGTHDCCKSALQIAQVLIGDFRLENYLDWTEVNAMTRLLQAGGVEGVAESAAEIMGWTEVATTRAMRGDLVVVSSDHRGSPAMGIITGNKAFVAAPIGWAAYSRVPYWLRCWSIG